MGLLEEKSQDNFICQHFTPDIPLVAICLVVDTLVSSRGQIREQTSHLEAT